MSIAEHHLVTLPTPGTRPIRVCYMIDNLAIGGSEKQLLALIAKLDRSQVQPYLCLLDGTGEASRALEPIDCPVLRLGICSLRSVRAVSSGWQFMRFLRRRKIDVVQLHFPDSTYFGAPLARLAGVKRVLRTRRNTGYWMTRGHRWAGRIVSRLVDGTIANSEACRQAVIEQEGARPESVHVIPNGIDLERFSRWTGAKSQRRVGVLANLRPVKRLDLFVKAAALLAPQFPLLEFQIAGEGECRASLLKLIDELRLNGRFKLVGAVDDVPGYLSQLDIAVLCSDCEGCSNSLLEYMAAGLPVVASRIAANLEIVECGATGLLCEIGDPASLAKSVARLLLDEQLARALGSAARRHAQANFSRTQEVDAHLDVYRRLSIEFRSIAC